MALFSKELGIDLGTANILVYVKGKGIVIREPSVVAFNKATGKVLKIGNEAKEMLGRTPGSIVAIKPMKDGVIAGFDITQAMIKELIKKANANSVLFKPIVIVCVPSGITSVEIRAVEEAVLKAGAKEARFIEEPMAAAAGAGLPVSEPTGSMVVDIGGGTTEVAVISLGGIVTTNSLRVAGDALDTAIVNYIKREKNLAIGERTAEDIKTTIGSAYPMGPDEYYEVRGRDLINGLPRNIEITSTEVREAMKGPILEMIQTIKDTLEKTPPELAADIMDRGIALTGGGAMIKGLDKIVTQMTGIPAFVAENPLDCVTIGTGIALENMDLLMKAYVNRNR